MSILELRSSPVVLPFLCFTNARTAFVAQCGVGYCCGLAPQCRSPSSEYDLEQLLQSLSDFLTIRFS